MKFWNWMYFSKVPVLSFAILWKNYRESLGAMAELASYQSASGLGFCHRCMVFAVDASFRAPSHQILATPLISFVPPLASFWSFFIWCAQRTRLYKTDRYTGDDTRRVVRILEFCLTTLYGHEGATVHYYVRLILVTRLYCHTLCG